MDKDFIKIGTDTIRIDAITELYIGTGDGKLYIFTETSEYDYDPNEYDVIAMFNTIINYLNVIEQF